MAKRGKYGNWGEDELQRAVAAYRNGDFGLNECARIYSVPKATIKRHADGKNSTANAIKLMGMQPTFNAEMENIIKDHLLKFEQTFFGFTIKDVRKLAFDIAEKNGLPHRFNKEKKSAGKKWYYAFMRRNPQLSLRSPEATSMARIEGFNKQNVMHFFDLLEKCVKDHNITGNTIFNVDETGFSTVQKHMQKVIALKGKKQVGGITSGERGTNTTAVCAASASGIFVPPMIIFKRKKWLEDLRFGAPIGSLVTISDTGYINSELFVQWLKHFTSFVNCSKTHPVLLLLDGHTTHSKNLEACEYARENGIILLQLPGHTTHRLQPLDVSFFGPMQKYFVQAQDVFMREHHTQVITQLQMSRLIAEAYGKGATVGNAASAFRGSGCWPVNRHVFKDHHFAGAMIFQPPVNELQIPGVRAIPATLDTPSTSGTRSTKTTGPFNDRPGRKEPQLLPSDSSGSEVDDSDKDRDYNPESPKKSFIRNLLEISPLPRRDVSTDRGQNRRGRGRPKLGPQKAVVITSSPYKQQLVLAREEKNMKEEEKEKKRKARDEKKKSIEDKKTTLGENKTLKTRSNPKKIKLEGEKGREKEKNINCDLNESTWYCTVCEETYEENMIRCMTCKSWVHTTCAGVKESLKKYICPLCQE